MGERAVFVDRDGTINEDVGHLGDEKMLRLLPGAARALRRLSEADFRLFIVTNQSGVGRGFLDREALERVNRALEETLAGKGVGLDGIYVCPHCADEDCDCRKPRTGMIKRAAGKFGVDLGGSYMVGDKLRDVETGLRAGCRSVLVTTGNDPEEYRQLQGQAVTADFVAASLGEAVDWILEDSVRGGDAG